MKSTNHEMKPTGLGRRQVLQATAWSAPVIAVAVAAPRAAASGVTMVSLQPFAATGVTTTGTSATLDPSLTTVTASSSQGGTDVSPAGLAIDGNDDTFWHSQYNPAATRPAGGHWIQLQAPAAHILTRLEYLARPGTNKTNGDLNGVANAYTVVGSSDAAFTSPVTLAQGTWPSTKTVKTATFTNATSLPFVRLYIASQYGNGTATSIASAAEIRLGGYPRSASAVQSFQGTAGLANQSVDPGASVTNAALTITVPAAGLDAAVAPTVSGAGWTFGNVAPSGTSLVFTFNYAGTVAPGASSSTLGYSLKGNGSPASGALPKTANGALSGPDFTTTTATTTWS